MTTPEHGPCALILSSSTGHGHDARADALAAWLRQLGRADLQILRLQVIEDSTQLGRFGVGLYNWIQHAQPRLHQLYWWVAEGYVALQGQGLLPIGAAFGHMLERHAPQLILSLHDSTNRPYFRVARSQLGSATLCATYCSEWQGGYGFSGNWIDPHVDALAVRTPATAAAATRRGVAPERIAVVQNWFSPDKLPASVQAQQEPMRPPPLRLLLAASGRGSNHHLAFLRALDGCHGVELTAVCGGDQATFTAVEHHAQRTQADITPLLWTDHMGELLKTHHAVVQRPGSNTTAEALAAGCVPILHNLGGRMPQELPTQRYLEHAGACVTLRRAGDLAACLRHWQSQPQALIERQRAVAALRREDSPQTWLQGLLERQGLARESAR